MENDNIVIENVDGDISLDDKKFNWLELKEYANEVYKKIVNQQIYVQEIVKVNKDKIDSNIMLKTAIMGLIETMNDLASLVVENLKSHSEKVGDTGNVDEAIEYMRAAEVYVAVEENILHLISTAHIDIFSKIALLK